VPSAGFGVRSFAGLLLLLLLPAVAIARLSPLIEPWPLAGYLASVSALTYGLYKFDKRRAQAGAWRTPESMLHLAELAGGWPAAFVAQRRFRHKTAKRRYQIIYWGIVLIHQYAAMDYLFGGRFTQSLWLLFQQRTG
jgi:uncharacterized membrane protein YsdA (DUF1294 family)